MTFETAVRAVGLALCVLTLLWIARDARRGSFEWQGYSFERSEDPAAFRREIILALLFVGALAGTALFVPLGRLGGAIPAVFISAGIVRSLWTGTIRINPRTQFPRRQRPFVYWTWLVVGALILAAMLALFLSGGDSAAATGPG